jgi:hypothetical protein
MTFTNQRIKAICVGLGCLMPLSTIIQLYHGGSLLVEETGVPRENHLPTLSHNVVSSTPRHEWDSNSQLLTYDHDHTVPILN